MSVELVASSPAHIGTIAARMRAVDVLEAAAMGHSPKEALRLGLRGSTHCYTAKVDGRAEAMFGLVVKSALGGEGTPWMLGTEAVYRQPRAFLRCAPGILNLFFDSTPRLSNLVAVENDRAIRMLRRLGFQLGEGVIFISGVRFLPFSTERC